MCKLQLFFVSEICKIQILSLNGEDSTQDISQKLNLIPLEIIHVVEKSSTNSLVRMNTSRMKIVPPLVTFVNWSQEGDVKFHEKCLIILQINFTKKELKLFCF